jgi:hypothetical protein
MGPNGGVHIGVVPSEIMNTLSFRKTLPVHTEKRYHNKFHAVIAWTKRE